MNPRFTLALGAATLVLAAGACSEDPALYLGGPLGPPTDLVVSGSAVTMRAGSSVTLGARLQDAVGNRAATSVTFASCDGTKVATADGSATNEWASTVTVTAVTLGESCVTATAAGLTETISVRIVPGTIRIVGPDTVLSGAGASFSLEYYSLDGTQLASDPDIPVPPVVSLNTARLPVSQVDPFNYDAAGQAPGNVTLQVTTRVEYGSVTANKAVTIVPGIFAGTVSATTAGQGAAVTVTGALAWDGDEYVTLGGVPGSMWSGLAADAMTDPSTGSLTFLVPWNLAPGDYTLTVLNQSPVQVAQTVTTPFTVTAGTPVANWNSFPGANTSGAELRTKISLDRPLAFPVVFSGNANPEDRSNYTFDNRPHTNGTADEVVVRIVLDWVDSCGQVCSPATDEDIDIEVIDGGFTAFLDLDGATLDVPESTLFNFQESTFYFVRIRSFSGAAQTHVVIQWLGDGNLCGDNGACNIGGEI